MLSDNVDSLFEEDSSGIINMSGDNLLKRRELHGLLAAVELLYIDQTEISASRSSRSIKMIGKWGSTIAIAFSKVCNTG